jgi:hypothetical protein
MCVRTSVYPTIFRRPAQAKLTGLPEPVWLALDKGVFYIHLYPTYLNAGYISRPGAGIAQSLWRRLATGWTAEDRPTKRTKKKLRGFGPLANYADRATAASWRSSTNLCG